MGGRLFVTLGTIVILLFFSGTFLIRSSLKTVTKWSKHADTVLKATVSTLSLDVTFLPDQPSVISKTEAIQKPKLNAYERGLLEKELLREEFLKEWIKEQEEMRLYPSNSPKYIVFSPVVSGVGNMLATLSEAIVLSWVTHRRLRSMI